MEAANDAQGEHDPFSAADATVALGVGKNMVKSIRFWGQATQLIREIPIAGSRRKTTVRATALGQYLFGAATGVDPYLELPGTVWVTHWWMLRPPTLLPAWWVAMNRFTPVEFDEAALRRAVIDEIDRAGWRQPNPSSVQKDVSCLLRMYVRDDSRATLDDLIDCPTRELGLISRSHGDTTRFRFNQGPKPSLPDLVVLHASLEWLSRRGGGTSVSVAALATTPGGPGLAFRLSPRELTEALERATEMQSSTGLSVVAGRPSLFTTEQPTDAAWDALDAYFLDHGRKPTSRSVRSEMAEGAKQS